MSAVESESEEVDPSADRVTVIEFLSSIGPIFYDGGSGSHIVTAYEYAERLLADPANLKNPDAACAEAVLVKSFKPEKTFKPGDGDLNLNWMDGADHDRVRGIFESAFHKRIAAARPKLESLIEEKLNQLAAANRFDLVSEYCVPVPVAAISHILGVEDEYQEPFLAWSWSMNKVFRPNQSESEVAERMEAEFKLCEYFEDAIRRRRKSPKDDLVSDLVRYQEKHGHLTDDEIRVNCIALLVGGNLSTTDLIGNTVLLLLQNPEQLRSVTENPKLVGRAVEETLRVEPPVEGAQRIVSSDTKLAGCPLKKGQVLVSMINVANRDPSCHGNPHNFDIEREEAPHISFGAGKHACIGAPLARLVTKVAVQRLFERFPELHLTLEKGGAYAWRQIPFYRGLEYLMLTAERC